MEVILTADVKGVGKKGEIVKANDSYARNVLIKKGQAVEATKQNLNDLKLRQKNDDKVAAEKLAAAKELAAQMAEESITVKIKTGEGGKVFGSISSKEIAEEIKKQLGHDVDKKKIQLPEPIKSLGAYNVGIKIHPQVIATVKVSVQEAK